MTEISEDWSDLKITSKGLLRSKTYMNPPYLHPHLIRYTNEQQQYIVNKVKLYYNIFNVSYSVVEGDLLDFWVELYYFPGSNYSFIRWNISILQSGSMLRPDPVNFSHSWASAPWESGLFPRGQGGQIPSSPKFMDYCSTWSCPGAASLYWPTLLFRYSNVVTLKLSIKLMSL